MEKILDWLITGIFIIAMLAIGLYVWNGISGSESANSTSSDTEEVKEEGTRDYEVYEDDENFEDIGVAGEVESSLKGENDNPKPPRDIDDEISAIMDEINSAAGSDDNETASETGGETTEETSGTETSTPTKSPQEETTNDSVASSDTPNASYHSGGKYMIIAGSFSTRSNAELQVENLTKKGYSPQIIQFDNSNMYTVSAARYDDSNEAYAAAKTLKNEKKVDCYVHKRR